MALTLHPQIAAALAAMPAADAGPHARGDWRSLRRDTDAVIDVDFASAAPAPEVTSTDHEIPCQDGTMIAARWYRRREESPGSAVVYVHGGGMISGSVAGYDPVVRQYVQRTGVPFLSVEYRLAPEHAGETAARDVFAALRWLSGRADELDVDRRRVALMGDSAGGGIAAAAAILARDEGAELARQILIYPMLDDRTTVEDTHIAPWATWTYDMNYTGWHAMLGEAIGSDRVSPLIAPGRLDVFEDLAPAYIEVGTLDIFRDESIAYAQALLSAGVDAELHVHPGSPHGQEWMGSDDLAARCFADRERVVSAL